MSSEVKNGLAAQLREQVDIQAPLATEDGFGGVSVIWQTIATPFAEVTPVLGSLREQVVAAHREARAAYRITLRKRSDVTQAMRILWQGRTLYIHGIAITRTTIELIAYEGGEA
ncbi:MAG: phage head closure protein [Alphaproteobacteria bacterium]